MQRNVETREHFLFLCRSSRHGQKKPAQWHLGTWTTGFYMCRTVKTSTSRTKVACTLTVNHKKYMFNHLLFFFYKVSIKNRFLYKMFFLLHLLQVQQHMMVTMTMRWRWRWLKQWWSHAPYTAAASPSTGGSQPSLRWASLKLSHQTKAWEVVLFKL